MPVEWLAHMTDSRAVKSGFVVIVAATIGWFALAVPAFAVPIPWKNCGSATDLVLIQQINASIWPPRGTPAPLQATPVYDSSGALSTLTVDLLLGPDWIFQTGNLAAPVAGGFVALPPSIPMTLVGPTVPIPAGPVSITQTLTSSNPGSQPVTIQSKAAVTQSITSVNATLTLTYNGTPGFPVPASTAGPYQATVRASEGSQEILCATLLLGNLSFVETPATSTALSSSPNPFFGQPITFTATVTSPSGTPAGSVDFNDGTTLLGTATVDASGGAAFTGPLAPGTHNVTATFSGSAGFAGSTSTSPVLVEVIAVPTPALDERVLLLLAIALAGAGALVLRRS